MRNQNGAWRHKYISNKVLCHSDYVRSGGFLFMKVFQALIENIREEIFRVKWKVDFGNRGTGSFGHQFVSYVLEHYEPKNNYIL